MIIFFNTFSRLFFPLILDLFDQNAKCWVCIRTAVLDTIRIFMKLLLDLFDLRLAV